MATGQEPQRWYIMVPLNGDASWLRVGKRISSLAAHQCEATAFRSARAAWIAVRAEGGPIPGVRVIAGA
jgi:hypothetical protein